MEGGGDVCKTSTGTDTLLARPDVRRIINNMQDAGVLTSVGDPDPDPLVRGTDPDSDPSLFS
jgi:hypothetical protein